MTNPRKRRRRVVQEINQTDAENFAILTDGDMNTLNQELSANSMARKIFENLQEKLSDLVDEQRDLKAELATRKKARTRSVRVVKSSEEDFSVGDAARYFAMNRWAFVPNLSWMLEDPDALPDDEMDRLTHVVPKRQFVKDYIRVLPASVRESYADTDIRSVFVSDMGNMRSQKVHDIKQVAYKLFNAEIAEYVSVSHSNGFQDVPNAQALELLGFKPRDPNIATSKDSYSTKPPFIFAESNAPQAERLFRVEVIAKAIRVILFAPSSLNGNTVTNNDTLGKMWGVTTISAPLIAFATVAINYLLSHDKEFTPTGKYTKMEYSDRYTRFRTWAEALPSYAAGRETLQFLNKIVFAGCSSDYGDNVAEGSDDEDLSAAIKAAAAAERAMNELNNNNDPDPTINTTAQLEPSAFVSGTMAASNSSNA